MSQLDLIPIEAITGELQMLEMSRLTGLLGDLVGAVPDASFIAKVREFGVLQPVLMIGYADEPEQLRLAAGRRRLRASQIAEHPLIPAYIFPPTWAVADVLALVENTQRADNPASNLASVRALLEKGADQDTICAAVGLTKQSYDKLLRLMGMIPQFLEVYGDGKIRDSVAEKLAKMPEARQQNLWKVYEETGKLKLKDAAAATKATAQAANEALPLDAFATPSANSLPTQAPISPEEREVLVRFKAEALRRGCSLMALMEYIELETPDEYFAEPQATQPAKAPKVVKSKPQPKPKTRSKVI